MAKTTKPNSDKINKSTKTHKNYKNRQRLKKKRQQQETVSVSTSQSSTSTAIVYSEQALSSTGNLYYYVI